MNWDAIGSIADVMAAISVIVTLFYLAVQIKQSTAVSKAELFDRGNEGWNIALEPLLDPSNAELFNNGLESYESLSSTDRFRFEILIGRILLSAESGLKKYEEGFVSADYAETYANFFRPIMSSNGGREYWNSEKGTFTTPMREWVAKLQQPREDD